MPIYSQSILDNMKDPESKGDECVNNWDYHQAILCYNKVLHKNPNNTNAKLKIAYCYNLLDNWEKSLEVFEEVESLSPSEILGNFAFQYADVLQHLGKFEEAKKWYQRVDNSFYLPQTLQNRFRSLEDIDRYYIDSSQYKIELLPFNTSGAEFSPYPYHHGLIYTTYGVVKQNEYTKSKRNNIQYDMFYYPLDINNDDKNIEKHFNEVNSLTHDGTLVIYNENKEVIFTRNNTSTSLQKKDKYLKVSHLGLYHADFDEEKEVWTNIQELNINHKEYSIGHPTITKDGKMLIFTSDMPDGFGGTDLYYSKFENGMWGNPVNMGSAINTDSNEFFPHLYQDSILYFSSEGHPGLGGMDIFKTILNDQIEPQIINLGYPINSTADDFGIITINDEQKGYFTSNRTTHVLRDNIYSFDFDENYVRGKKDTLISENIVPEMLAMQGMVIDQEDKMPLINARITIVGMETRDVKKVITDSLGWFKVSIRKEECYAIKSEKDKYFTFKQNLHLEKVIEDRYNHTIEMEKIKVGQVFRLDNIYYEYAAYDVNEEAKTSLMTVVELLKDNPQIKIELSSHTDSRGSNSFNETLSQKRAKAAAEFIISQGIPISRIQARGYGESQLVFPCGDNMDCGEEQHLQNRRTEMKILENN